MLAEDVGKFLRSLRLQKGITQRELAAKINVTHQAVSRWENGKSIPDVDTLRILGEFYQVSVDEILQVEVKKKDSKVLSILNYIILLSNVFFSIYFFMFLQNSIIMILLVIAIYLILLFLRRKSYYSYIKISLTTIVLLVFLGSMISNLNYYTIDREPGFVEVDRTTIEVADNESEYLAVLDDDIFTVIRYSIYSDYIEIIDMRNVFEIEEVVFDNHEIKDIDLHNRKLYITTEFLDIDTRRYGLIEYDLHTTETELIIVNDSPINTFVTTSLNVFDTADNGLYEYNENEAMFYLEQAFTAEIYDMVQTASGKVVTVCEGNQCNVMRLSDSYDVTYIYFEEPLEEKVKLLKTGNNVYVVTNDFLSNTSTLYKFNEDSYQTLDMELGNGYFYSGNAYTVLNGELYNSNGEIVTDYVYLDSDFNRQKANTIFQDIEDGVYVIEANTVITLEYMNHEALFFIAVPLKISGIIMMIVTSFGSLFFRREKK